MKYERGPLSAGAEDAGLTDKRGRRPLSLMLAQKRATRQHKLQESRRNGGEYIHEGESVIRPMSVSGAVDSDISG